MLNFDQFDFIICGQVLTGRIEVLEEFFRKRFKNIGIIGTSNIFANYNAARRAMYKNGGKCYEDKLFNLVVSHKIRFKWLFFIIAYSIYFFSVIGAIFKFKFSRKNVVFIGIGAFPALLGIIARELRLVGKIIFYSIDYFPKSNKECVNKLLIFLDKICVKGSDVVWSISPKIIEAREKYANLFGNQYKHMSVPLCFDETLLRFKPADDVARWTIVFVGTSGYFHGLQLLIDTMPKLIERFPQIKIKIIGAGSWEDTKKKIEELNLSKYFDFLGFIKEEKDLFDVVSRCALGLALYVPVEANPAFYADPGKPKLYAFCGVPVVISKVPAVAEEIESSGAGKAIEFSIVSLTEAIEGILLDDDKWGEFRKNAFNFAKRYTSKSIFEPAFRSFLDI